MKNMLNSRADHRFQMLDLSNDPFVLATRQFIDHVSLLTYPDLVGKVIWWRRRELNPRPQVLYRQFYILSPVVWF